MIVPSLTPVPARFSARRIAGSFFEEALMSDDSPEVDLNAWSARYEKHLRATADRWARGVGPPPPDSALREFARWQFEVHAEYRRRGETPPPVPGFFYMPDDTAELDAE
jgi:hypothetical protein